jgi:hypothetical protein
VVKYTIGNPVALPSHGIGNFLGRFSSHDKHANITCKYFSRVVVVVDCCDVPFWRKRLVYLRVDKPSSQCRRSTASFFPAVPTTHVRTIDQRQWRRRALWPLSCNAWSVAIFRIKHPHSLAKLIKVYIEMILLHLFKKSTTHSHEPNFSFPRWVPPQEGMVYINVEAQFSHLLLKWWSALSPGTTTANA